MATITAITSTGQRVRFVCSYRNEVDLEVFGAGAEAHRVRLARVGETHFLAQDEADAEAATAWLTELERDADEFCRRRGITPPPGRTVHADYDAWHLAYYGAEVTA